MKAFLEIGNIKGKPKDFFEGYIEDTETGERLCGIHGNYMGFLDFD